MISMNRTHFFLDSKHKHMIKRGAPLDKFGVLPIELHGFTSRIDF